jgi:glycosyltransferase involved in cell wall biosynthesis
VARASQFAHHIVVSTYNRDLMADLGFDNVTVAIQGVDPLEMYPGPKSGRFAGRFVVYSGGKLEYRKGQDIVVAAFRAFHQRHPEALLVTTWHNHWAAATELFDAAGLFANPTLGADGTFDLGRWVAECGLPAGSHLDLSPISRQDLRQVLCDADVAVFPNRAEPGTNLVAMEAMACGAPTVLSNNTGHLDIIAPGVCFPLRQQAPVPCTTDSRRHWGESSVEELLEAMEDIHANGDKARAVGSAGSAEIHRKWSWTQFTDQIVAGVNAACS